MAEDVSQGQQEQGQEGEPTDWEAKYREAVAHSREWERRAKANVEKAKAYDEAQEAGRSELEKANARAEKAEAALKEAETAAERQRLAEKVAAETGVPAALIHGDDEEAMAQSAKAALEYAKSYRPPAPRDENPGSFSKGSGKSDMRDFAQALLRK